jgi:hypothetical protein
MGIRSIASGVNVMLLIAQIALGVIIGSLTIALLVTCFFSLEYSALPQARMIIVSDSAQSFHTLQYATMLSALSPVFPRRDLLMLAVL